MNLEEFVSESLILIVDGVRDAQRALHRYPNGNRVTGR
jgi:hypothetical protein